MNPDIYACVLAAGLSSRFGSTKLTGLLKGVPLVQHALAAAQGACAGQVGLVVGHDRNSVIDAAANLCNRIIVNTHYEQGMGTSIAAGVRALRDSAEAIVIALADQPLVTTAHLNDLIHTWSGSDDEVVASAFDGIVSPPILFPRNAYDRLSKLTGDAGAKEILSNDAITITTIEFPPARWDVDTPTDLARLNQA